MKGTPRIRIFAGPNGSGKSTIKTLIDSKLFGIYINPDEIEKAIKEIGYLDFKLFRISTNAYEVIEYFSNSTLLIKLGLISETLSLKFSRNKLYFPKASINSYYASVAADFIRQQLLKGKESFTFETVMSSMDKIDFLSKAQSLGYRTYLYYVATDDPLINLSRVKQRVQNGGHNVPEDKIISRYHRSLDLLFEAIRYSNRAFIFDNSGNQQLFLAEIINAQNVQIMSEFQPYWFKKYVLDKF